MHCCWLFTWGLRPAWVRGRIISSATAVPETSPSSQQRVRLIFCSRPRIISRLSKSPQLEKMSLMLSELSRHLYSGSFCLWKPREPSFESVYILCSIAGKLRNI